MGTYADQILWEKCQKQFKTNVQQEALKEQLIAPLTGLLIVDISDRLNQGYLGIFSRLPE